MFYIMGLDPETGHAMLMTSRKFMTAIAASNYAVTIHPIYRAFLVKVV